MSDKLPEVGEIWHNISGQGPVYILSIEYSFTLSHQSTELISFMDLTINTAKTVSLEHFLENYYLFIETQYNTEIIQSIESIIDMMKRKL